MAFLSRFFLISFLFGSVFFSCVKDQPEPQPLVLEEPEPSERVFVVNEGNFTSGNASISLYNRKNNEVQEDQFKAVNNMALGDVAQSMVLINDKYYIVVNNSGKVVVCDKNFKLSSNITGFMSPRYMLQVSANKAYVSDYKSGCISVVNLSNNALSHSIVLPGWTEEMVLLHNKVYVCNVNKEYAYVIDPSQDKVEDSIWVGKNASGIQADKNAKLWVLSSGDFAASPARLSLINTSTHDLEKSFVFAANREPFKLAINGKKDTLYFIDKGVCAMPVNAAGLPDVPLVTSGQSHFYGIGVHPITSEIYVSDALDYVQRSHITVYSAMGSKKAEFKAGINANGFYFE
ncbi:MAG: hypothetical protein JNK73_14595 [Bacteroidia bacterium]|nr:hypothetical protein [Bacteroidia bacterium]